mmetsp:Transcript_4851/g.10225  ORF Transcript_4851/g.10225 Transcript_4851/m.10225 type:complete len:86 (+) Transcript_4851:715-972(+)
MLLAIFAMVRSSSLTMVCLGLRSQNGQRGGMSKQLLVETKDHLIISMNCILSEEEKAKSLFFHESKGYKGDGSLFCIPAIKEHRL